MKRLFLLIGFAAFLPFAACAQPGDTASFRTVHNKAFKRGEDLKYRLHYGAINAGTADITIDNSDKMINGRPTFHAVGTGTSLGAFDWFYKVRDRYESYIDEEGLMPWIFIRRVDEGGFKINQNQAYDQEHGHVNSDGKVISTPRYIQDMISAFYYARTIDFTNAKPGQVFSFPTFVDNEIWQLQIKYLGKETIDSDIGKINCIKFCPVVQKGRIFKSEDDLSVWISDDANHIPVRARAQILVGSIKMDLASYSGLANTLNLVK